MFFEALADELAPALCELLVDDVWAVLPAVDVRIDAFVI
jgi:hypothetical protein